MTEPWPTASHHLVTVLTPGERVGLTPGERVGSTSPSGPTMRNTLEYVGVVRVCHTIFHVKPHLLKHQAYCEYHTQCPM